MTATTLLYISISFNALNMIILLYTYRGRKNVVKDIYTIAKRTRIPLAKLKSK
tara:strand:- start:198 stop:356 length:159 start_codon:yes stop_codon:yes gene_type:complete